MAANLVREFPANSVKLSILCTGLVPRPTASSHRALAVLEAGWGGRNSVFCPAFSKRWSLLYKSCNSGCKI